MTPRGNAKPTVRELKARLAECESDLHAAVDELGGAVEATLDWKKAVRDHPVQSALIAAAVGLIVIKQPGIMKQLGLLGLRSLGTLDAGSLVQKLVRRFMP
jgi:hypothetical protein